MKKIYRVISKVDNVPFNKGWYNNVHLDWFVVKRDRPIVSYWKNITNYLSLIDEAKNLVEFGINEFFSYNEVVKLKNLLISIEPTSREIQEIEIDLPIDPKDISPLGLKKISANYSFFHLYAFEGYNLDFKVAGLASFKEATLKSNFPEAKLEQ